MLIDDLRLMLVLDIPLLGGRDPVATAVAAVRGGVTIVQLRWKGGSARAQFELATRLRAALSVPLIMNDRPDIALAAGCAGVHLGADDLPITLARRIVPPGFIIGASVGDEKEGAAALGADYVGIGPWRETTTKADAGEGLGVEGVKRLLLTVKVPAVVIGGVRPEDVKEILRCGAVGVAVAGGILSAADPEVAALGYSR
jgi:thiamine-phosphate diphosphorylase